MWTYLVCFTIHLQLYFNGLPTYSCCKWTCFFFKLNTVVFIMQLASSSDSSWSKFWLFLFLDLANITLTHQTIFLQWSCSFSPLQNQHNHVCTCLKICQYAYVFQQKDQRLSASVAFSHLGNITVEPIRRRADSNDVFGFAVRCIVLELSAVKQTRSQIWQRERKWNKSKDCACTKTGNNQI